MGARGSDGRLRWPPQQPARAALPGLQAHPPGSGAVRVCVAGRAERAVEDFDIKPIGIVEDDLMDFDDQNRQSFLGLTAELDRQNSSGDCRRSISTKEVPGTCSLSARHPRLLCRFVWFDRKGNQKRAGFYQIGDKVDGADFHLGQWVFPGILEQLGHEAKTARARVLPLPDLIRFCRQFVPRPNPPIHGIS